MKAPAAGDPLIGRTLGDFVVGERLGAGGFGVVYRAEQPLLEREAVIKVLHRQQLQSETGTRRFLREARLASRLDHPYAAHIYAFGAEPDGLLWIAMELVRGTGLDQLLADRGAIPLDRLVPLVERICEVVHSAHEQGIVHRDIKPANVLVMSRAGRFLPKLLDFGIAKAVASKVDGDGRVDPPVPVAAADGLADVDPAARTASPPQPAAVPTAEPGPDPVEGGTSAELPDATVAADCTQLQASPGPLAWGGDARVLTQAGTIMGSPHYMAPEQWMDPTAAGPRTDIYALGTLIYQALTGRRPFAGSHPLELASAHRRAPVPPLGPGFAPALDEVVARAMAKDPAARFASALELSTALRAASGLELSPNDELPRLDDSVERWALAEAPQPIAEAVAELAAARNPHQARDAARDCVHAVVRYLGLVALACRSRVGPGRERDAPEVVSVLRELRRRPLDDQEWWDLVRELCRPFAGCPDLHPVPELVTSFFPAGAEQVAAGGHTLELCGLTTTERGLSAGEARDELARTLPALARFLRRVHFVAHYPLVVWSEEGAESWMGVRRPRRVPLAVAGASGPPGQAALLDGAGHPVVALAPLMQVAPPVPGAPPELFLFVGPDRHRPRLLAPLRGFELHDDELWDWFGLHLIDTLDQERPAEPRAPYRGLLPFTAEDAGCYVGREREVEAFVNRLRTQSLLAVVAPSGAGKSSFVQAGVLPALGHAWRALVVRPGLSPVAALVALLDKDGAGDLDRAAPDWLGAALRARAAASGTGVVLVVDQFEELFTLCRDAGERETLAALLAGASRSPDDPVRVILTLRDDFLLRAEELPALRDRLSLGLTLLPTPARADLLRILVEPARRAGYDFEDAELPARMVDEVVGRPGALALLSFTAARLWQVRNRHFKQLGRRAYDALGGVAGALAQHADASLAAMATDEQRLVREAFRHLITAEGTRAVLARDELVQLMGAKDARGQRVIERLVAARLLVVSEGEGRRADRAGPRGAAGGVAAPGGVAARGRGGRSPA